MCFIWNDADVSLTCRNTPCSLFSFHTYINADSIQLSDKVSGRSGNWVGHGRMCPNRQIFCCVFIPVSPSAFTCPEIRCAVIMADNQSVSQTLGSNRCWLCCVLAKHRVQLAVWFNEFYISCRKELFLLWVLLFSLLSGVFGAHQCAFVSTWSVMI